MSIYKRRESGHPPPYKSFLGLMLTAECSAISAVTLQRVEMVVAKRILFVAN